jgi:Ca2+-binding RTX toxin-like protein
LRGGPGNDDLAGDLGDDVLEGGDGHDRVSFVNIVDFRADGSSCGNFTYTQTGPTATVDFRRGISVGSLFGLDRLISMEGVVRDQQPGKPVITVRRRHGD